jgi:hypothetical protein
MTWEELKEKAKDLGYRVVEDDGDLPYLGITEYLENEDINIIFCDYGSIETNCGDTVAENRTPDQMYQIMLALR